MPSLFGGPGMGAQRAAWEAAFTAELAAHCRKDHLQVLLDLVKAFETVPHDKLVAVAVAKGYSLVVLCLSIAAYRLRRSVGADGVYSRCVIACRGITAGSGFATFELRLLLLDTMLELQKRWSTYLSAKLYVDDLTLSASGLPAMVVRLQSAVVAFVTDKLENGLGLEISAKKSVTVASRISLAEATAEAIRGRKVRAARRSKLLGTDTVGGRRRTRTFKVRLVQFTKTAHRFHALRRAGIDSRQMVRVAGTPSILYGCEAAGVSDSALQKTRSAVARAAAPQAGGKNPDATLLALDANSGTLDPAFMAHVSPTLWWATAWWEHWFTPADLALAFRVATRKLATGKCADWAKVTGPVGAVVASLRRLGWSCSSAKHAIDDRGATWSFVLDAPAAIAEAVRQSVRRWRLARIASSLPGLVPDHCDVAAPSCPEGTLLVDFAAVLRQRLATKKGSGDGVSWTEKWRGDLISAVSGGQWPQARKAAVTRWGILDNTCQLCKMESGTLEHRFRCSASLPVDGWPQPPRSAQLALERMNPVRRRLLQTRALMVVRVPRPPIMRTEWFQWMWTPPDDIEQCTWYLDGSMLDGDWQDFRALAFAIAIVSEANDLLAFGMGCPPLWCRSAAAAAAAEAWALFIALSSTPFPPKLRTDCLSLLRTAEGGLARATAACRPLARLWSQIGTTLDGNICQLTEQGLLVWMPAHQSTAAIGNRALSNGDKLSVVDWRANQLVDALAKQAAAQRQAPMAITRLLASARAATKHAAALLGRVTHAANNCALEIVQEDGTRVLRTCRDSASKPRQQGAVSGAARQPHLQQLQQSSVSSIAVPARDLPGGSSCSHWPARKRSHQEACPRGAKRAKVVMAARAQEKAIHEAHAVRLVDAISSQLSSPVGKPSAEERMKLLLERVRARSAAAAART